MYCHGVDIGASAVKVILLSAERGIVDQATAPSGYGARDTARRLVEETLSRQKLSPADVRYTIATGYGRVSFAEANEEISEISCLARGARHLYSDAHTIIDIGGQDSKAIRLLPDGHVANFALNDKCAAGTGRFLEVMANILGVDLEALSHLSQQATSPVTISSTCTVFAESEVISHISGHLPHLGGRVAGRHHRRSPPSHRGSSPGHGSPGGIGAPGGPHRRRGERRWIGPGVFIARGP